MTDDARIDRLRQAVADLLPYASALARLGRFAVLHFDRDDLSELRHRIDAGEFDL